jgi:hypothetical protein
MLYKGSLSLSQASLSHEHARGFIYILQCLPPRGDCPDSLYHTQAIFYLNCRKIQ